MKELKKKRYKYKMNATSIQGFQYNNGKNMKNAVMNFRGKVRPRHFFFDIGINSTEQK